MLFISTDGHRTVYHRTEGALSPSDPLLPLLKHQHTVPVEVSRVEVSVGRHRHALQHQQVSKPRLRDKAIWKYTYKQWTRSECLWTKEAFPNDLPAIFSLPHS